MTFRVIRAVCDMKVDLVFCSLQFGYVWYIEFHVHYMVLSEISYLSFVDDIHFTELNVDIRVKGVVCVCTVTSYSVILTAIPINTKVCYT
jgi:hypothetical protein